MADKFAFRPKQQTYGFDRMVDRVYKVDKPTNPKNHPDWKLTKTHPSGVRQFDLDSPQGGHSLYEVDADNHGEAKRKFAQMDEGHDALKPHKRDMN